VAAKFPERVERLVIINAPHWSVSQTNLRRNPGQMLKSWYFLFFQLPRLPEALWRWSVRGPIAGPPSRAGMFTGADPELYRQAWLQPGSLTAMINWYRAAVRGPRPPPATPRIGVPTLLIWGSRDPYLGREMARPSVELCDNGRLVYLEDASHWVHHERADEVNRLIGDFLSVRP
jgi:pimeloyl-ACP methyl ester carboxylesterase